MVFFKMWVFSVINPVNSLPDKWVFNDYHPLPPIISPLIIPNTIHNRHRKRGRLAENFLKNPQLRCLLATPAEQSEAYHPRRAKKPPSGPCNPLRVGSA